MIKKINILEGLYINVIFLFVILVSLKITPKIVFGLSKLQV